MNPWKYMDHKKYLIENSHICPDIFVFLCYYKHSSSGIIKHHQALSSIINNLDNLWIFWRILILKLKYKCISNLKPILFKFQSFSSLRLTLMQSKSCKMSFKDKNFLFVLKTEAFHTQISKCNGQIFSKNLQMSILEKLSMK